MAEMKKVTARKTVVRPMFWMTDDEAYQRLLPDGLMTDGSQPRRCVREGEGGMIRHNDNMGESEQAKLSIHRGQVAAGIKDPERRKKFIAEQGEEEAANKGKLSRSAHERLSSGASRERNRQALEY